MWRWMAIAALLAACSTTPSKRAPDAEIARVNAQLALQYLQRGDFEAAVEKIKRSLAADRSLPEAHTSAALVYERVGQASEAEDHYQMAIELTPRDRDESGAAYNNYGVFLCNKGQISDAVDNFKQAFSNMFYKTPEIAYENAGVCLAGRPDQAGKAEGYLRKALDLNPKLPLSLVAMAQLQFDQRRFLQARAFVQRAHGAAAPTAASVWLAYRIEMQIGDSKAAADLAAQLRNRFADTTQARQLAELQSR